MLCGKAGFAPVEGDVALACLVVKGGEARSRRARPRAAAGRGRGRLAKDRAVQPLLGVAKGDQAATRCPTRSQALVFGRSNPSGEGTLVSPIQSVPQALAPG
jgi:hypothetical protein